MPSVIHNFDPPERFVAGTVGPPGQRTFFLQARSGTRVTSVALEKQQVLVLAERIDDLLDEVLRVGASTATIPAVAPLAVDDSAPLEQPLVEEFRVGTLTLSWDAADERVVVEAFPLQETDDEAESEEEDEEDEVEPDEVLVVRLPPALARAFSKRAQAVVSAGRPPCPFCGGPLDASGHLCPRSNGFRRSAQPTTDE